MTDLANSTSSAAIDRRKAMAIALAVGGSAAWAALAGRAAEGQSIDYSYFPPPETSGGWRSLVVRGQVPTASRKNDIRVLAGLDWDRLNSAFQWARSYSSETTLLVIRRGWIGGEFGPGSTHLVGSVTKSLTGLSVARMCYLSRSNRWGRVVEPTTPAWTLLPATFDQSDTRKRAIRLEHLSSMTSGLAPDDAPYDSRYSADHVLRRPVIAAPGTFWSYCSASTDLLGMAVQTLTRQNLRDFFNAEIGRPLGMAWINWDFWSGYNRACCAAWLTARDLARIGFMLLRRGRWRLPDGRWIQILDEPLVDFLTRPSPLAQQSQFRATANSPFQVPSDGSRNYGNTFWTNTTRAMLGWSVPADAFYAHGYGESLLIVVPSLDLVVVRYGWGTNVLPSLKRDLMARIMAALV